MKIGIITFHASHNYGSNLQAWALQTFLENQGHEVEIINYRSYYQKSCFFKLFDFTGKYWYKFALPVTLKRLIFYPKSIKASLKKWNKFEDFITSKLHLTKEFNTIEQLGNSDFDYDLVIAGSDQIWIQTEETGEAYFLNFLKNDVDKISYAPSLGPCPEKINIDYLKSNLQGFKGMSVREKRSQEFLLQNKVVNQCKVVCDPTLLLEEKDYESLIETEPIIKEPYIFFYSPSSITPEHFKIANELGEKTKMKVITSEAYYPKDINTYTHICNYIDVGPKEFLNLIKFASYTIGASFHLLVFSILFKKNFYCINGDVDSRTENLLSYLQLRERSVSLFGNYSIRVQPIDNYDKILKRLNEYRYESITYLKQYV